jgi:hypothetical protein
MASYTRRLAVSRLPYARYAGTGLCEQILQDEADCVHIDLRWVNTVERCTTTMWRGGGSGHSIGKSWRHVQPGHCQQRSLDLKQTDLFTCWQLSRSIGSSIWRQRLPCQLKIHEHSQYIALMSAVSTFGSIVCLRDQH